MYVKLFVSINQFYKEKGSFSGGCNLNSSTIELTTVDLGKSA